MKHSECTAGQKSGSGLTGTVPPAMTSILLPKYKAESTEKTASEYTSTRVAVTE